MAQHTETYMVSPNLSITSANYVEKSVGYYFVNQHTITLCVYGYVVIWYVQT